jgi:hypothetical protein
MGITATINREQIILGAIGDHPLKKFVTLVNSFAIDM